MAKEISSSGVAVASDELHGEDKLDAVDRDAEVARAKSDIGALIVVQVRPSAADVLVAIRVIGVDVDVQAHVGVSIQVEPEAGVSVHHLEGSDHFGGVLPVGFQIPGRLTGLEVSHFCFILQWYEVLAGCECERGSDAQGGDRAE